MWLRKTSPRVIQRASDRLDEVGFEHSLIELEAHHLAGGNVQEAAECVATLWSRGDDVSWETVTRLDLAGRDLDDARRQWHACGGQLQELLLRVRRR